MLRTRQDLEEIEARTLAPYAMIALQHLPSRSPLMRALKIIAAAGSVMAAFTAEPAEGS